MPWIYLFIIKQSWHVTDWVIPFLYLVLSASWQSTEKKISWWLVRPNSIKIVLEQPLLLVEFYNKYFYGFEYKMFSVIFLLN